MSSAVGQLQDVRDFYDHWSSRFLAGFGSTFQAGLLKAKEAAVEDPDVSTCLLAERAGIQPGHRVVDLGCGVGGPAIAIASHFPQTTVHGITISTVQSRIARDLVTDAGLGTAVTIAQGDYHHLPFADDSFDSAAFFESIGYSPDRPGLLDEVTRVVKPGGRIYIKDVFARPPPLTEAQERDLHAFDRLWHLAKTPTIAEIEDALVRSGCEILGAGPLAGADNARFLRAMFDFDPQTILRRNDLGETFALDSPDLPTFFGDVVARVGSS